MLYAICDDQRLTPLNNTSPDRKLSLPKTLSDSFEAVCERFFERFVRLRREFLALPKRLCKEYVYDDRGVLKSQNEGLVAAGSETGGFVNGTVRTTTIKYDPYTDQITGFRVSGTVY